LIAAPLAVIVYMTPFVISHGTGDMMAGLQMVWRENVQRFYNPVNHRGPVYLYCYVILELLAPWTLLLPAALVGAMPTALRGHGLLENSCPRKAVGMAPERRLFPTSFFWSVFVFFTLSASRRSYYLLPILPAAAMLVAAALVRRSRLRTFGVWLFAIAVYVSPIVAAVGILWIDFWKNFPIGDSEEPDIPAIFALAVAWAVSAAAIAFAMRRRRHVAAALVTAAFAFETYLFVFALPEADALRTQRPFAEVVRQQLATGDSPGPEFDGLALYRTSDIVYYLDPPKPLPELKEPDEIHDPSIRWLIVRTRDRATLELGEDWDCPVMESYQPWDGVERRNAKLQLLRRVR
jgi:4-amino-4-deoxy-L-arabinose transferase-like glycosyltransferase